MKKYNVLYILLFIYSFAIAQEDNEKKNVEFDRWSVELNAGQNKAIEPFTDNYFQSGNQKYFNFSSVNSFSLGIRRMFSPTFGLKLNTAYNTFENEAGTSSLPFETKSIRASFEGVINLSRALKFESFTNRLGVLLHAGIQVSNFSPNKDVKFFERNSGAEDNGGFIFGLTPQYKIADWLALTADFSYSLNVRQHYTWDGMSNSLTSTSTNNTNKNNLTGGLVETSVGLTFYLGKKEKHADWYVAPAANSLLELPSDRDQDGIIDINDDCPDVWGPYSTQGCPDTDKDGVNDKNDKCPTVFGFVENNGCPWPDTDGDTVLDKDDNCPTVFGLVSNSGCPKEEKIIDTETAEKLNNYANLILFDSNKYSFQKQTYPILMEINTILVEYPNSKFSLEGHTDSDGDTAKNQELSENRAFAVKQWLIENGIDASRLTSNGYGESMPRDTNATKYGKSRNRRVEIKLIK